MRGYRGRRVNKLGKGRTRRRGPGTPSLTQPGPEAADRVAPSRPRAPSAVLLVKPKHVDSDHVPGSRAQSSGRVPQEPLRVLVPGQAVGGHGLGGPGGGRVAAARVPEQQQKQRQQRQQLGPRSRAGLSGATGHGGRRRRAGAAKEGERGRTGGCGPTLRMEGTRAAGQPGPWVGAEPRGQPSAWSVHAAQAPGHGRPESAERSPSRRAASTDSRRGTLQRPERRLGGFEGRSGAGRPAAPWGDPAARPGLLGPPTRQC